MESEGLAPADSAIEPDTRRKTPDSRLVWRWMRLLLGCLVATLSDDLLVDKLPAGEAVELK